MSQYVVERADPRQLSVNITSSSGRVFRWGPDESAAENIPSGLSIMTQMPGGFGQMSCTLTRRPDLQWYDFDRFAPATVTGAGGSMVAFDGYLSAAPMSRGSGYTFTPSGVGWSAHMKDDASFSMVYIDRQLSKWQGPGTARQIAQVGPSNDDITTFSWQALADASGNPCLQVQGTGPWTKVTVAEEWYDAGANNVISAAYSTLVTLPNGYGNPDPHTHFTMYTSPNDVATGASLIAGLSSLASPQAFGGVAPVAQRYGLVVHYYDQAAGSAGTTYGAQVENLFVVGNHGLTLRAGPSGGSTTQSADSGYYGGDIVADIIARAAPKLNVTRGTSGNTVYQDTFVVPNLAFNTPVDADTAIQQLNQYYLYDYGVYEGRNFFWRPPGSGMHWKLRVGDGVQVTSQGPQIETAFNGVIVQYTDPAGVARYVGPPGYTGDKDPVTSATGSALLQDTTLTNPCNLYGRKRWALVQMGTATWQVAVQVGYVFLQTSLARPSSGTASVTGFARDSSGRDWPVWMIRSGDTCEFVDTNDNAVHYILQTDYSHDQLQNSLTLDAPPNEADWLISRLGLAISALG